MTTVAQRTASPDAVFAACIANRKLLDRARDRKATIESKLDEAEAAQERAAAIPHDSEVIKRQGEDLAAAVAMGQAPPEELKKSRAELERLEASYAKALAQVRVAGETVAGLERMLADINAEIDRLVSEHDTLIVQALRAQAETAGAENVEDARRYRKSFMRLLVIENLLSPLVGGKRCFAPQRAYDVFLPAFSLDCQRGLINPTYRQDELFSGDGTSSGQELVIHVSKLTATERERLRALGVEL